MSDQLRVGSMCAGVGGIDLGFECAGARTVGLVEWDKNCQDVLAVRFPRARLYSDLKEFHGKRGSADVVVGGTPCQDLSVAGLRAGLAGSRSGLFFDFARVVSEIEPEWFVWENVGGALTSGRGRDMGTVIATLAGLGYGVAWRVLDAQYFGVAQRRRRVVVVGRRGDPRSAAQVLALGESVPRNPPARDTSRALAPADIVGSTDGVAKTVLTSQFRYDKDQNYVVTTRDVSSTLQGGGERGYRVDAESAAGGQLLPTFTTAQPVLDPASTLLASAGHHGHSSPRGDGSDNLVATYRKVHRAQTVDDYESWQEDSIANTLNVFDQGDGRATTAVAHDGVRRLTPVECERLNGFPSDWTLVTNRRGKPMADGPRYKMMGNSVAVPVFQWVAERMVNVHENAR